MAVIVKTEMENLFKIVIDNSRNFYYNNYSVGFEGIKYGNSSF